MRRPTGERRRRQPRDFFICPHCGAEVETGAAACPDCGSDETTGWSEDADSWQADIPAGYEGEDTFDYQKYIQREFGGAPRIGLKTVVAVILLVAFVALVVLGRLRTGG